MKHDAVPVSKQKEIDSYLSSQLAKDTLRFVLCGSVDDGKSTLLGRVLHDTGTVAVDELKTLEAASKRYGTQGDSFDLALLVDGLKAEWEQGITIDVAYRFFETENRKFIAADAPGHKQYTRNMATGASTASVAVVLVDASKGILTQTRRHSNIVAMMGIRDVILAVNKMDLVDYSKDLFEGIAEEYTDHLLELGLDSPLTVPMSALNGENVLESRGEMGWYQGPTFMDILERMRPQMWEFSEDFRLPVQRVNRPNSSFRGVSGTVVSGQIECGAAVTIAPSGEVTTISRILGPSGKDSNIAIEGQSITLVFSDDVDVGRGDVVATADRAPCSADQFAAHMFWMDSKPMLPHRSYGFQLATASASAHVTELAYEIDVDTLQHSPAKKLEANGFCYCKIALDRKVAFEPYRDNRSMGGFILLDKITNSTAGAGMIDFALHRASNVTWQPTKIDKAARSRAKKQRPRILWFTGLSGAGKSTVANKLEQKLHASGVHTYLLDGDNVRLGLNRDLGFTDQDRVENVRRVAEVAKLMADAGLIVIVALISPFRSERELARDIMDEGEFIEIFVDTPLAICEERDPKGLYGKARSGVIENFTGIDSPYEPPEFAEIVLKADRDSPDELADQVLQFLNK